MKKKVVLFLFFLFTFFCVFPVNAEEYKVKELIPADSLATVNTEKFNYQDFMYNSQVDSKGFAVVSFNSIQNNTISKIAVSVNMLLFDENRINIGLLSYCTDKDIESDYNGFKLSGKQASPFSIRVTNRYFAEGKAPKDVRYIAIFDENKYCHIGGYTNYAGLTLEEIAGGGEIQKPSSGGVFGELLVYIKDKKIQIILIIAVATLLSLIVYGNIVNSLYKKMYAKSSFLAYLPITCFYLATKLAFGSIVSIIYLVLYLVSAISIYFNMPIIFGIMNGLSLLSLLVDIIKLVTKNYDLLILDPAMKGPEYDTTMFSNNNANANISMNQPVDLTYSNQITNDDLVFNGNYSISTGNDSNNVLEDEVGENQNNPFGFVNDQNFESNNTNSNNNSNSNNSGESDLSKYFK